MSDTQKVQIAPQAAYVEGQALIEFYRNRNLLLAQQAFELAHTVEAQSAEIAKLKAELSSRPAEGDGWDAEVIDMPDMSEG